MVLIIKLAVTDISKRQNHSEDKNMGPSSACSLAVTTEADGVVTLPVGATRTTLALVVEMALEHTTVLLSSGSETTEFAVLVDSVANPVDARITANSLVGGVNHDHLKVLVGSILAHPIRVEHTKATAFASCTLLSLAAEGALELELVHTHVCGLTICGSLGHWALTASTLDSHTVDDIALLRLVAETTGFVGAGRARCTVNSRQLAELPAADSQKEAKQITLLALVKFFEILVGSHGVFLTNRYPSRVLTVQL